MDADTALLTELVRRAPVFEALREEALDRRDLQDRLDCSKPTVHRIVTSLGEKGLVRRENGEFELTPLGATIAEPLGRFEGEVEAAIALRPVLARLLEEPIPFDLTAVADARVTRAEPGDPYKPVNRFASLVADSDTLRGFDTTTLAPIHVESIHRRICDGMTTEIVYHPAAITDILTTDPDRGTEALDSGNLSLWTHEDLPCGLAVFDDRVGIGGYDEETGMLSVFVDTDDPDAREWALALFEHYKQEADPLYRADRVG